MTVLTRQFFHDEAAAYAMLESILWPFGPVCPHCGAIDRIYRIKPNKAKRVRLGLCKCGHCRKQFTVKVGTVFEQSHVPLNVWFQAVYLMCSSKKGISSNQIHRSLGVTLKTAWFMTHRIRLAMDESAIKPIGGWGHIVEIDETFIGHDKAIKPKGEKRGRGAAHKYKVLSLVDRATGQAKSMVVDDLSARTLIPIIRANVGRESRVMTDEAAQYRHLDRFFADHGTVHHTADEYVLPSDETVHTNTIEGYFSVFKRGMKGVYQHCGPQHIGRYLAEFDFRYSNRKALGIDDADRTIKALAGIVGKRLTYKSTGGSQAAQGR